MAVTCRKTSNEWFTPFFFSKQKRMNSSKRLFTVALAACCLLPTSLAAQEETEDRWYWGVAGGFRTSHMRFSDIDENYFPTNKNLNGGVFSLFVQGEFGRQRQFGIRPQLSFLKRLP